MPRRPLIFLLTLLASGAMAGGEWKGLDRKIAEYYHYFPLESHEVRAYKLKYQMKLLTEVGCLFDAKPSDKEADPVVTDKTQILVPLRIENGKSELVKPGNGVMDPGETFDDEREARVPLPMLVKPGCHVDTRNDPWFAKWSPDEEDDDEDDDTSLQPPAPTPTPTPTPKSTVPPTKQRTDFLEMIDDL